MRKRLLYEELDQFIKNIDASNDLDRVLNVMQSQVKILGFDRLTYWLRWPNKEKKDPIFLSTYPDEYITHYIENDFQKHDMVGRFASSTMTPFLWNDIEKNFVITKMQKVIFSDSASAGLKAGGSIPVNGPGAIQAVFSVVKNCSAKEFEQIFIFHRMELQLLATYAHEKIMTLGITNPVKNIHLSSREIEILTWTSQGKTYWEIGCILGIQENTVKKHMLNIFEKLNVTNNTHAVSKALIHGIINP